MKPETLALITPFIISAMCVGSRVTCDPAPTDTDLDVLVLVPAPGEVAWTHEMDPMVDLTYALKFHGWTLGGSLPDNTMKDSPTAEGTFCSWTKEEENLIITQDKTFHSRFVSATKVCKHLNLMDKADRIHLFQAVLYGASEALTNLPYFRIVALPPDELSLDDLI